MDSGCAFCDKIGPLKQETESKTNKRDQKHGEQWQDMFNLQFISQNFQGPGGVTPHELAKRQFLDLDKIKPNIAFNGCNAPKMKDLGMNSSKQTSNDLSGAKVKAHNASSAWAPTPPRIDTALKNKNKQKVLEQRWNSNAFAPNSSNSNSNHNGNQSSSNNTTSKGKLN